MLANTPPRPTQPAPQSRWAQLTYASYDLGDGTPGGWQEKDVIGYPTEAERRALRRNVVSQFGYHGEMPKFPSVSQIQALPVRMAYTPAAADRPAVYSHAVNAGVDSTDRPGNVFSHVLIDRTPDSIHPIDLWKSPSFARPSNVAEIIATSIAAEPQAGPLGSVETAAGVLVTPGYTEPILAAADALMHVAGAGAGGANRVLVLVSDRQDWSAIIIMALQYVMSPSAARRLSWSLYERAAQIPVAVSAGVQIVAIPECDLAAVDEGAYVLLDGDLPRIEGGFHRVASGPLIPVTPFSQLITHMLAQPERLRDRLNALVELDAWAAIRPTEVVSPAWPLAALLATENSESHHGQPGDQIAALATSVATHNPPRAVAKHDMLMSEVGRRVATRVHNAQNPWAEVECFTGTERDVAWRHALLETLAGRAGIPQKVTPQRGIRQNAEVVAAAVHAVTRERGRVGAHSLDAVNFWCAAGLVAPDTRQVYEPVLELIAELPQVVPTYSGPVELTDAAIDVVIDALERRRGQNLPALSPALAEALTRKGLPAQVRARAKDGRYTSVTQHLVALTLADNPDLVDGCARALSAQPVEARPRPIVEAVRRLPLGLLTRFERAAPGWLDSDSVLGVLNAHPFNDELHALCQVLAARSIRHRAGPYARVLMDAYAPHPRGVDGGVLGVLRARLGDIRLHAQALSSYLYAYVVTRELMDSTMAHEATVEEKVSLIETSAVDATRVRVVIEAAWPRCKAEDLIALNCVDKADCGGLSPTAHTVVAMNNHNGRIMDAVCAAGSSSVSVDTVIDAAQKFVAARGGEASRNLAGEIKKTIKLVSQLEDAR